MADNLQLQVGILFEASTLKAGLQEAVNSTQQGSDQMAQAMTGANEKIASSTDKAKATLVALGEEIGISVPQEISTLLAQLPGVATALKAAFAPAAIVGVIGILAEAADKIDALMRKEEEQREAWISINAMVQDTTVNIVEQINQQEQKYIELTQGPIAALTFAVDNRRSVAISSLAEITGELTRVATQFADQGGWRTGMGSGNRDASRDVKKTIADVTDAMHKAQLSQPKDPLAPFVAEEDVLKAKIKETNTEIDRRSKAMGNDKDLLEPLQKEVAIYQQLIQQIELQKELQEKIGKADQAELGHARRGASMEGQKQEIVDLTSQVRRRSEIESKIDQTIRAQADAEAAAQNALTGIAARQAQEAEKQLQWENQRTNVAEHIDQLQRDIVDHQAEHNAKMAVALGYMTQEQAAQQALKQLEADKKQALDEINSRLNAQIALLKRLSDETMGGLVGSDQQKAAFRQAVTDYQNMKVQQLEIEKKYDLQIESEQLKLTNTFSAQLRKQMLAWQQVHQQMGQMFLQTLNSMNQNLASFITTGQANWKQLAASAIEEIIKIGLQWIESHTIMALLNAVFKQKEDDQRIEQMTTNLAANFAEAQSAAGLAGANTMATMSLINPIIAPAVAAANYLVAQGFADIAGFAAGGIVPMDGIARLHRNEVVLPASMSGKGDFGNIGGRGHVHVTFAPTIQALDADGVDAVLTKHRSRFVREFEIIAKKKGFGR